MGRDITFFADYHSQENSVTNFCGLILKMLYEDSPSAFEEVLASLIESDIDIQVGPRFNQQSRQVSSIPDLAISQKAFSLFFETKLTDWFYSDQIQRHISGFSKTPSLNVLFLLSTFESDELDDRFADQITIAKTHGVILQPLTFEDFADALQKVKASNHFQPFLEDFLRYLDANELLPKWKYLLDVVNCAGTLHEVEKGCYMCPDSGGAYRHRRAKYFGPYASKQVSAIHEILAVVIVDQNQSDARIAWNNSSQKPDELKHRALNFVRMWDWRVKENSEVPLQVFILDSGIPTSFVKDSPGGMLQSKKYFWDIARDSKNGAELASKLASRRWSEF